MLSHENSKILEEVRKTVTEIASDFKLLTNQVQKILEDQNKHSMILHGADQNSGLIKTVNDLENQVDQINQTEENRKKQFLALWTVLATAIVGLIVSFLKGH